MTESRIFCVTLVFNPPGPLHSSLLIAPDETMAAAMAMRSAMAVVPEHASLVGTAVFAVDPDVLRQMLRAVEGRETGRVVSLVRPGTNVPTSLCPDGEHEWDDKTCVRCGAVLTPYQYAENRAVAEAMQDAAKRWPVEQFGPPMPEGAA